ncbi:family 16 glycoside hydrolase [Runella sp.]|uniref:family 16 glycoside hydrolase n=1 Tax=Runella sp. TaxID=1960881 RepID=UPI003D1511CE
MKTRTANSFILFFLLLSNLLRSQTNFKDWQAFSENNTPVTLPELNYKDKACFKLDGKNEVIAFNKTKNLENFRIDLDIAGKVMSGIGFHVKNEQNYQFLYFRPGYGGTQEAIQYVPIYNGGLSWVFYHYPEYEAKTDIASLEWFHAAIEVKNKMMRVYVNHKKEADMAISLIETDTESGPILLRSLFGESYFANIKLTELPKPLTDWAISEQLSRDVAYDYSQVKKVKSWTKINAKYDEIVNLGRYFEYPNGTVLAKRTIVSETDKPQILSFDFTGKLQIFLNGKEVFNYAKYLLDRLTTDKHGIVLDLKKGDNELVFISEGDAFFFGKGFNAMGRFQHQNWGFTARLSEKTR